jgi:hypothetical protein
VALHQLNGLPHGGRGVHGPGLGQSVGVVVRLGDQ